MSTIRVSREKGREVENGFEFRVIVPRESLAAFFAAFPGYELDLIVPEPLTPPPIGGRLGGGQDQTHPTQSVAMQGWDSGQVGMTLAPNADVLALCRLPTFQEYVLAQLGKEASQVEDIDLLAFHYALEATQKDIVSITAEDYVEKLMKPFNEWLRGRG